MLIIAIPKSASTSLMVTLGRLHGIPSAQAFSQDTPPPPNLRVLHRYHSDIREISEEQVREFSSGGRIFKQHIPPTAGNLRLLSPVRKVILLRDPREVIGAYYRAEERRMHSPRLEFQDSQTLQDWLEAAGENGLLGDLEWFREGWVKEARENPAVNLIVEYSHLMETPTETVNAIESFFGLPESTNLVLSKERYSRGPWYRHLLGRWWRMGRDLLGSLKG
jgi:hypothetical protein